MTKTCSCGIALKDIYNWFKSYPELSKNTYAKPVLCSDGNFKGESILLLQLASFSCKHCQFHPLQEPYACIFDGEFLYALHYVAELEYDDILRGRKFRLCPRCIESIPQQHITKYWY